jgi:hypothetical protein
MSTVFEGYFLIGCGLSSIWMITVEVRRTWRLIKGWEPFRSYLRENLALVLVALGLPFAWPLLFHPHIRKRVRAELPEVSEA